MILLLYHKLALSIYSSLRIVKMDSSNQYTHAEKYEYSEVKLFAKNSKEESQFMAFLHPTMSDYMKSEMFGKKVLDIGCGTGYWSYKAALSGAKSVDGFDIQEDMVQLAKQATSQFNTINICIGDVVNMPYDDNSFDVAISFYVTCCLRLEACISHFTEMYRVLTPGGKAMMVSYSASASKELILRKGANRMIVEKLIAQKLISLPNYPSQDQVNNAFEDLHDVLETFFNIDQNGKLQRVTDGDKLSNGQAIWVKTEIMTFADYFYTDEFLHQQIKAAGLNIDSIENYYTEERRIAYNSTKPEVELDKAITATPPFIMYHLSKPLIKSSV